MGARIIRAQRFSSTGIFTILQKNREPRDNLLNFRPARICEAPHTGKSRVPPTTPGSGGRIIPIRAALPSQNPKIDRNPLRNACRGPSDQPYARESALADLNQCDEPAMQHQALVVYTLIVQTHYLPKLYKKKKNKNDLTNSELEIFNHLRRISRYINALLELRIEMEYSR